MSRSLIVMPDDSAQPILDAIAAAKKSLRIKMFLFSDPALLAAVIAAQKRGVKVRVMLNPARRGGEPENEATRRKLEKAGVEVIDSNPAFAVTHEKSMVVDDETAFVKSLNWETKNLTETRDYAVTTAHRGEVAEIVACFEADWHRKKFDAGEKDARLIWCNYNGRDRIAEFIDRAKHTLFVQNERYQDAVIIERLVRAARRGVKIHVMARPPHTLKKEKLVEGVGRYTHPRRRRRQGPQAQAPQAPRQDAARRRQACDRRFHQSQPGKLRQPARAGHRSGRQACGETIAPGCAPRLEALSSARPHG